MRTHQATTVEHPGLLPGSLLPELGGSDRPARARRSVRDWLVDVACLLAAVALGAMSTESTDVGGAYAFVNILIGAAAMMAIWIRRRWPVHFAVAMIPIATISPFAGGAAVVAIFTVGVHRPSRISVPIAAGHAFAGLLYCALFPDESETYVVSVILTFLFVFAALGWGLVVRARRQLLVSLTERAERAESDQQARMDEARRAERERIAREMHDVLAHRLSLLSLHAGAIEFRPDAPTEDIVRAAGIIRSNAHQGLEELREVISVLREDAPGAYAEAPQPTLADLPALAEESRAAGTDVALQADLDPGEVPVLIGRHGYRVVQEGLTNVRKHAPGCTATVTVSGAPGTGLRVEIANPVPFGAPSSGIPGTGTGLAGLAERVALAGGTLEHGPDGAGNHQLRAWLPWTT